MGWSISNDWIHFGIGKTHMYGLKFNKNTHKMPQNNKVKVPNSRTKQTKTKPHYTKQTKTKPHYNCWISTKKLPAQSLLNEMGKF